jgi:predicted enzyme related to lactoylglutathione lyase
MAIVYRKCGYKWSTFSNIEAAPLATILLNPVYWVNYNQNHSTMTTGKQPTYGNGKICYMEMAATDVDRSAAFYKAVFGWNIRKRGDGAMAFDDGVGEVSGSWIKGRTPATSPGLLVYIMVDDMEKTIEAVIANGGTIVQPVGMDAPEITARFSDPAGNIIGLYQNP